MGSNPFDIFTLVTLLILAVIMPLNGIWDFRRLLRWIEEGRADARIKSYTWILIMQWGLVLGLGGYWVMAGRGLAPLRLIPTAAGWQWLAVGIGATVTAYTVWQMFTIIGSSDKLDEARDQIGELIGLAPQSAGEMRWFNSVAVTAGVCEEILYRGILLAAMTPLVGMWPAVFISSVIFGLGHAYQGPAGILKTSLIGLFLALLTVFSGSLFVAMLLHTVGDITSGRIMAAADQEVSGSPETKLNTM